MGKYLRVFRYLIAAITALALCTPLWAQFRSSVEGTVSDSSGAVVTGALVTLTNVDTGVAQTSQSNDVGSFRFPSLPPGNYKVAASKSGFKTITQENVVLTAQEIRTIPMVLQPGQTQEVVTVTAEPPAIQLSEAKIASDISAREIRELPLPGRNVLSILSQTPGVTGVGTASQNASNNDVFSLVNSAFNNANGQRGDGNSFYVDNSLANSNPDPGAFNLTPNPDSVQELHVAVNDYSAESGRSGSLVIQAVTKSGTNQFHGSLFEYHQDNALTALNAFEKQSNITKLTATRRNEFGGSVGGPIQKDKMFFFFSWDQKRQSQPDTVVSTVETPQFVDFMKANFPNNLATKLLTSFPATTSNGLTNIQTVNDLYFNPATSTPLCPVNGPPVAGMPCNLPIRGTTTNTFVLPNNGLQWNVRIDRYFSKDRIYGNFYRKTPNTISPNVRPAFNSANSFAGTTNYVNLDWTHTFSANIVNDAAGGITRISGLGTCSHCEV
ncbi:MAG TPA: carboxypeptidase-like regulatory domain-containing protein, partial [Nitrososphaera sp.]|nr:carboxypeptidase-like regulatory domain-containing protein [Nitrososphaera sp.]